MKRLFRIATVASAIIFGFLVIIWPVSYSLNLSKNIATDKMTPSDSIPLISGYRLGFEGGSTWLYNWIVPYRGSIISLSGTNDSPPINRYWSLGDYDFGHKIEFEGRHKISMIANYSDLPGIYFRQFWVPGQSPAYFTLKVSLLYPILLSAFLPFLWIWRRIVFRKKSS